MSNLRYETQHKLERLVESFQKVLYEDDTTFLENMQTRNLAGDDVRRYQYWEWTQGVGLFGIWKLFEKSKDEKYLHILMRYYEKCFEIGLPAKNVNTCAPLLVLSYLSEYCKKKGRAEYSKYDAVCGEWCQWIYESFPRTKEGGLQHITSDTENDQELWDDTLFMTVLFLGNYGRINNIAEYVEEAEYQFLLHTKYLADKKTGLWYHGFTFHGNHNFVGALWGRGNCWITIAIPEFLNSVQCSGSVHRFLKEALQVQVDALKQYQNPSGMWHTLVNDRESYPESSATCGFAYGILKAVHTGLIDPAYREMALKALEPMLGYITEEGTVSQVSYGTAMGRETKEFYKNIEIKSMPYGQALAILFLFEVLEDEVICSEASSALVNAGGE